MYLSYPVKFTNIQRSGRNCIIDWQEMKIGNNLQMLCVSHWIVDKKIVTLCAIFSNAFETGDKPSYELFMAYLSDTHMRHSARLVNYHGVDIYGHWSLTESNIFQTGPGHVSHLKVWMYRTISNIRRTKSQNLNDSCLVMQLSLPNPLKSGVKSRMKM